MDPTRDLPMVGASGAISAVLGAYLVLFPRARIQSLVFLVFFYELIAVPSVIVLGFWFLLQLIDGFASLGLTDEIGGGIALWAHIGGFVAGARAGAAVRASSGRLRPGRPPVIVPAGAAPAARSPRSSRARRRPPPRLTARSAHGAAGPAREPVG